MLEVAAAATGVALDMGVMLPVAHAGKLAVCRWLCKPGRLPLYVHLHRHVLEAAAAGGHTEVCEWALLELESSNLHGRGPDGAPAYTRAVDKAIKLADRKGHVETAEWLLARTGRKRSDFGADDVLKAAAEGYDLPAFQQLCAALGGVGALSAEGRDEVLVAAVVSTTPDWKAKAAWCMEQGCELGASIALTAHAVTYARLKGGAVVERWTWLAEQGHASLSLGLGSALLGTTIEDGNAAAVRYLLGLGIRCTASDVHWRSCNLDLDVLQALLGAGCGLGSPGKLAERACRGGQLPIVQWLLETYGSSCLHNYEACLLSAVGSGDVRLVRWLREQACAGPAAASAGWGPGGGSEVAGPSALAGWDRQQLHELWREAAASGSEAMLELLLEWGCPLPVHERGESSKVWPAAARNDDLRTLRVLRRLGGGRGIPWGSEGTFAACVWQGDTRKGSGLGALQWLVAEGCPVKWAQAESAARERVRAAQEEYGDVPKAVLGWVKDQRADMGGLRRSVLSVRNWAVGKLTAARSL